MSGVGPSVKGLLTCTAQDGSTCPVLGWTAESKRLCALVQDAHVYVSESNAGTKHEVHLRPSRQAYLVRTCL